MNPTRERLILPEPARALHARLWGTIAEYIDDLAGTIEPDAGDALPLPAWSFGGGTILAARWDHRQSHDLDVQLHTGLPLHDLAHGLAHDPTLTADAEIIHAGSELIEVRRGRASIDLYQAPTTIAAGHRTGTVQGQPAGILPSAEILHGKLRDRGLAMPTRDLLDLAVASETEATALEIAINAFNEPAFAARRQQILEAPAPDELPHRTANALIHDSWRWILPEARARTAAALADSRYTSAHLITERGRMPAAALTRNDGQSTVIPFFDLALALGDRGLTAHPMTRELTAVSRQADSDATTRIVHAWGKTDVRPVERALAVEPVPAWPASPPLGETTTLADVAAHQQAGEHATISWLVHTSGEVDLRVRYGEEDGWRIIMRGRDARAMSTALVESGVALAESTGITLEGSRSQQVDTLTEIHGAGVQRWMRIYQARER